MKIPIDDEYMLTTDAYNFILKRIYMGQRGKSKNQEQEEIVGFYPSIPGVMEALVQEKLRRSTAKTLQELVAHHKTLCEYFKGLFDTKKELGLKK